MRWQFFMLLCILRSIPPSIATPRGCAISDYHIHCPLCIFKVLLPVCAGLWVWTRPHRVLGLRCNREREEGWKWKHGWKKKATKKYTPSHNCGSPAVQNLGCGLTTKPRKRSFPLRLEECSRPANAWAHRLSTSSCQNWIGLIWSTHRQHKDGVFPSLQHSQKKILLH